jgi:hypothetical protein
MSKIKDKFILGTANFGDKISFMEAEVILGAFFEKHNSIQTATNYPMSAQIPFGSTLNFLKNYLDKNDIKCNLTINIGSLSNNYTDNNDLTPTFFYANFLLLKEMFPKQNLTLALHWDNKNESREDLVDLFCELQNEIKIGLSGIEFPANYSSNKIIYECQVNSYIDKQRNFMPSTLLKKHLTTSSVIGYQILGGRKILFDRIKKLSDLYGEKDKYKLLLVVLEDNLTRYDKVIIGPKNLEQTLAWLKTAEVFNEI